jgi:hypothetical protein
MARLNGWSARAGGRGLCAADDVRFLAEGRVQDSVAFGEDNHQM